VAVTKVTKNTGEITEKCLIILTVFITKTDQFRLHLQQDLHQSLTDVTSVQAPQLVAVATLHHHWYQLPTQPATWDQLTLACAPTCLSTLSTATTARSNLWCAD